jgi:hypothetical protein
MLGMFAVGQLFQPIVSHQLCYSTRAAHRPRGLLVGVDAQRLSRSYDGCFRWKIDCRSDDGFALSAFTVRPNLSHFVAMKAIFHSLGLSKHFTHDRV